MLRVICKSEEYGNKTVSTIWEGGDVRTLSREYPPSDVFGADPLGSQECDGGDVRYRYHFEELLDGKWKEIPDPRVRIKRDMTHSEREIDRENRRLFPGDFL